MRWFFVALFGLVPLSAAAQDCDSAENTVQMNACLSDALDASDAALNVTYKAAMESLTSGDAEYGTDIAGQLKAAQRAWIAYRDLACAAESALYEGGSIQPGIVLGCLARLTDQRVTDLSAFLPN